MTDHSDVGAPRTRADLAEIIEARRLKVELEVLQCAYDTMADDMKAMFARIARGEQVELRYPDGTVVPVTRARRRESGGDGQ